MKEYRYFINRYGEISFDEMNSEEKLLNSSYFERLNQKIGAEYLGSKSFAIFSICTRTRPYFKSTKWKAFMKNFSSNCDFLVLSNAGIIPMEYSTCFPFQNYNAAHESKNDELFQQLAMQRIVRILNNNNWKKVIFLLNLVDLERWNPILEQLKDYPIISLPTEEIRQKAKNDFLYEKKYKVAFKMYPLTHPYILQEVASHLPPINQHKLF